MPAPANVRLEFQKFMNSVVLTRSKKAKPTPPKDGYNGPPPVETPRTKLVAPHRGGINLF